MFSSLIREMLILHESCDISVKISGINIYGKIFLFLFLSFDPQRYGKICGIEIL